MKDFHAMVQERAALQNAQKTMNSLNRSFSRHHEIVQQVNKDFQNVANDLNSALDDGLKKLNRWLVGYLAFVAGGCLLKKFHDWCTMQDKIMVQNLLWILYKVDG